MMATNKEKAAAPAPRTEAESEYTARELADNYRAFDASREIVAVALRLAGVKSAAFSEAKRIIDDFRTKEV